MSGLVGIWNLDGAPVDRPLLERMTSWLALRGPDAQEAWNQGPLGMGHALLRTTYESEHEHQPFTLEGVTVVADLRLDARAELIASLDAHGREVSPSSPDAELLLHAYHVWGDGCSEHLLGDFAFAIWDPGRQRLFCARDPFGVKPFFYVRVQNTFVFSNTLDCIRLHPAVSNRLNEMAMADFLLFDSIQDPAATAFAEIQRLPAAHALTASADGIAVRRYWSLPDEDPLEMRRPAECVERFRALLHAAVQDRLRTPRASIQYSGGLDSNSVAAAALHWRRASESSIPLRGFTASCAPLIPDEEGRYAATAARALGIPLEILPGDGYAPFDQQRQRELRTPEPCTDPFAPFTRDLNIATAAYAPVTLTGQGGDPAFSSSLSCHFRGLIRQRRFGRILRDLGRFFSAEGRFSRLYARTRLRVLSGKVHSPNLYPAWLNPEFAARLGLRARWEEVNRPTPAPQRAPRPSAYETLRSVFWSQMFETLDPGFTRLPLEFRHPFFDLRVLRFVLRLPALPWCSDKELLRQTLRGVLPDEIRLRRKTPLVADPVLAALRNDTTRWTSRLVRGGSLEPFIQIERVPEVAGETDGMRAWINLRPLSLQIWLQELHEVALDSHAATWRSSVASAG